ECYCGRKIRSITVIVPVSAKAHSEVDSIARRYRHCSRKRLCARIAKAGDFRGEKGGGTVLEHRNIGRCSGFISTAENGGHLVRAACWSGPTDDAALTVRAGMLAAPPRRKRIAASWGNRHIRPVVFDTRRSVCRGWNPHINAPCVIKLELVKVER